MPVPDIDLNDPVARHMRTDFCRLRVDQTVGEALAQLRSQPPRGRVLYFYVVDADGRLEGVIPTRRLLLSPLETPLREIMVTKIVSIPATATVLDACEFFTIHRLLAFPILEAGKIVGVVDVELYTEELEDLERSQRSDALFQLIGVHLTEAQQASPVQAFRIRFPWLLCNIGGGILAAFLSGVYEAELKKVVALALFVPVVLALAESVAIQSVSLALQLLHGERPTLGVLRIKLRRELQTGILLGAACGLAVAVVSLLWLRQPRVAACLVAGIGGGVACAALIGAAIPNLLRLLRRDPQVAAGPVALAGADMFTLFFYFSMARWLFA
ncbi:MAG: magnesium transporter [Deltaproteobacteria bacterium]